MDGLIEIEKLVLAKSEQVGLTRRSEAQLGLQGSYSMEASFSELPEAGSIAETRRSIHSAQTARIMLSAEPNVSTRPA